MTDNVTVLDYNGDQKVFQTTDNAGVHIPWHVIGDATGATDLGAAIAALLATIDADTSALAAAEAGAGLNVSGSFSASGSAASGAAVADNPFAMGGVFETSPGAVDSGDIRYVGLSAYGAVRATLESAAGVPLPTVSVAEDDAFQDNDPLIGSGFVRQDTPAPFGADGDWGPGSVDALNQLWTVQSAVNGPGGPTGFDSFGHALINVATGTQADQEIIAAPGTNKQIWIYALDIVTDGAAAVFTLQDEDDTAIAGPYTFAANMGMVRNFSGNYNQPLYKVPTNKAFEIDKTGTGVLTGAVQYAIVDVS